LVEPFGLGRWPDLDDDPVDDEAGVPSRDRRLRRRCRRSGMTRNTPNPTATAIAGIISRNATNPSWAIPATREA
jgi:hypothetical protein